jgi:hypothetical protein
MPAARLSNRPERPARRSVAGACMLLAVLAAGCQAQPVAGGALAADTALMQRIEAEVGAASCVSSADCRTLPIGSKACGGPARWMAWSVRVSSADRLQALAQDLAQQQRQRDMAEGRMSTCSVVPDPGAQCDAGRCVLARGKPMQ